MGSSGGGGGNTRQTVVSDLPEWSKPYWQGIAASGRRLARQPYRAFEGQRVVGFDPMEKQAFEGVQSLYDAGPRRELGAAEGIAGEAARRGFDTPQWGSAEAYNRFANPYLEQVMEPGRDRLSREYQKALGSGLRGATEQGIGTGTIGGRSNLAGARTAGAISDEAFRAMREYEADMRGRAFDQAQEGFFRQADLDRSGAQLAMDAGTQLQNLAEMQQSQALQRIESLRSAGLSQRELEQSIKDIAYEDYLTKRDYQKQQLNWFTSLLSGTPYNVTDQTQTTATSGGGPTMGQSLTGLGVAALGAYGKSQS